MSDLLIHGWAWGLAYAVALALAIVFCAGIEKKCGPDVCPWEGVEAANDQPRKEETAR
jgi:hypothetical protein